MLSLSRTRDGYLEVLNIQRILPSEEYSGGAELVLSFEEEDMNRELNDGEVYIT